MSAQITLNWTKDSTFETLLDGHKVTIDTTAENGGNNEGPRPKALMLVALAGCSAMDVISLFLKMRVRFDKISIDVTAETSDTIPMVYTAFHATYHIDGNIGDAAKIEKAIRLSQEKYCGVGLMMKKFLLAATEVSLDMGKELRMHNNPSSTDKMDQITVDPIPYESVALFNSQNGFASFLVPAILILVLQQTLILGIGMLGGTAREKNRFHSLVPICRHFNGTLRIVFGKSLTYLLLYVVVCIWVLAIVPKLFSLPQVGEPLTILLFLLPYLFACIFMSMTLSGFMTSRESPMLVFVFTSVILLFISGVSWPEAAIPPFWKVVGYLFPSTPGIQGFIRINTAGASLHEVAHEYRVLWIQAGVYFILSCIIYRYQIIRSRKMIIKQYRYMKMRRMLRERE